MTSLADTIEPTRKPRRGRPPISRGEGLTEKFQLYLPPSMMRQLREAAAERRQDVSVVIRSGIARELNPQADETCMVPLIASVPCGPWAPIWESQRKVDIGEVGHKIGINPDDFLVEASGLSMIADNVRRHIPDGAWVLLRLGDFREGQICLCRADVEGQEPLWTLKKWTRDSKGVPKLVNGKGEPVEWPANVTNVQAIAGFRTAITSHLDVSDKPLTDKIYELEGEITDLREASQFREIAQSENFIRIMEEFGYRNAPEAGAVAILKIISKWTPEKAVERLSGEQHIEAAVREQIAARGRQRKAA